MASNYSLRNRYTIIVLILLLFLVFIPIVFSLTIDKTLESNNEKALFALIFGVIIFVILIVWVLGSIRKIGPERIGCVIEFGRPMYQIGPGLHFVPNMFCELRLESKLAIEEQIPEDTKSNPIRITHGITSQPTGDPLDTRLTTSVNFKYRYKINDYVLFIQNVGNRWELKRQVHDIIVNTAAIECAKFTLAINLDRRGELNHLLNKAVKDWTKDWGIEFINIQLQEIDLGNEIDKAQTNVSVTAINIASNRNNAQKIIFDGSAEAQVHKMFQYAKAEGIREIADKLGVDDKTAIYQIETLANVWRKSNADLNLYGNDVQQLFGMLMSFYKEKESNNVKLP